MPASVLASRSCFRPCISLETKHHARAETKIVLMVVIAVFKGSHQVVGFCEAKRETRSCA